MKRPLASKRPIGPFAQSADSDAVFTLRFDIPAGTEVPLNELRAELVAPIRDMSPNIDEVSIDTSGTDNPAIAHFNKLNVTVDSNPKVFGRDVDNPMTMEELDELIDDINKELLDITGTRVSRDRVLIV